MKRWPRHALLCKACHSQPHSLIPPLLCSESERGGRNAFVQRAQISLVSSRIIRGLPPGAKSTAVFTESFAEGVGGT